MVVIIVLIIQSNTAPPKPSSDAASKKIHTLADGYPLLPIYPGAKIDKSQKKSEQGLIGYLSRMTSNDKVSTVMKWYRQNLTAAGWAEITPPEFPDTDKSLFAQFQKDKMNMNLEVSQEETPETEILISFPLQAP